MNLHEYQGKQLLKEAGISVLPGVLANSSEEAVAAAEQLGGDVWVVKAQVHAGGRGLGGGIKLARSLDEVRAHAEAILGMTLITPQTGAAGKVVHHVYVEAGCAIDREFYMSLLVDRAHHCITLIASSEGGMDVEKVAEETPEKVKTIKIDILTGVCGYQVREIGVLYGLDKVQQRALFQLITKLYNAFLKYDLGLLEINPLVLTQEGNLQPLDARMVVDDNAIYRHPRISEMRDLKEDDPAEIEAMQHDLNYIKLDGEIGCMVNGAGLAMATMDIIQYYGASPANFLDVGGGATREKVTEAFKLILSDKNVKGVLVNIFGGIMRCDVIAEGIIEAVKEVKLHVPLVVRLEGTAVDAGISLLKNSKLPIVTAKSLDEAAQSIIHVMKEAA